MTVPKVSNTHESDTPVAAGEHLIEGPAGILQLEINIPPQLSGASPVAVLCHPHPLHGGSMHNKVVHILAKTFEALDMPVVRFNFRGIGKSQGQFDQAQGEVDDLVAVAQWVSVHLPNHPLWLAGFSFGAYISVQAYQQVQAERLLLVAPPVSMYDFTPFHSIAIPWMVIQGGQDEIVDPLGVKSWLDSQIYPAKLIWLDDADHFFHGKLNRIRDAILETWP